MAKRDVIVIGASAGGVKALLQLFSAFPPNLDAAVFVVLHMGRTAEAALAGILGRRTTLHVHNAQDGEPVRAGQVYVARPDHHLLVKDGFVRLTRGPQENGHRPAVDPLFRSAARTYGARVIAVVLSGALDDGTSGLTAVKMRGGLTVVQDPATASYPSMPSSALAHVKVDHIASPADMGPLLARLATEEVPEAVRPVPPADDAEANVAFFDPEDAREAREQGAPSAFSCPDCHGVLWQIEEGQLERYRCRTGHAYTEESLVAAQNDALEEALWAAYRALRERAALATKWRRPHA